MKKLMIMSALAVSLWSANVLADNTEYRPLASNFEPQYNGGYPTKDTATKMFDEYDYQAATQFYVWAYAYLNGMALENAAAALGGDQRSFYTFDKRISQQHVVMTANTEVIYTLSRYIDLTKGPVVVETPAKTRGHFFDLSNRAYMDSGFVGPDMGKGGKYFVVNSDYTGEVPDGYFEVRVTQSNLFMFLLRTFPMIEGSDEAAVKRSLAAKWYYYSERQNPPTNNRVMVGKRPYKQEWPKDERAFEWLAQAFNLDKVPATGKAHLGNMRRLGLVKGQTFAPDDRAKVILKRAAKTGQAMVKSMAFRNRLKASNPVYDNRNYTQTFYNKSPQFMQDNYEEVEERAHGWHQLASNFTTYIPSKPGTGAFYMNAHQDGEGNMLMGQNTYRLHVPANVPIKLFWQMPVYDVDTRSLIDTDQKKSGLTGRDDLTFNKDGSVDLYFGPSAPQGFENNWIKTIKGQGWFMLPRFFGPLEPVLDKTWRLDDIERIK